MSDFLIYHSPDGAIHLDVSMEEDGLWLSETQIATLFQTDASLIANQLSQLFHTQEVDSRIASKSFSPPNPSTPKETYYNLETILALGFRLNSTPAKDFRKWATTVLSNQLVNGYSLHTDQLMKKGFSDIDEKVNILRHAFEDHPIDGDISLTALKLILKYAKTWNLLLAYDEDHLSLPQSTGKPTFALTYKDAIASIKFLKSDLLSRKESSDLFGHERDRGLESILHNIEQTFQGQYLYPTIEEKAAHLLYFVIKDHPFTDGNKRIGCFLFLLYLNLQNAPARLNENGLLALALLIAQSHPDQKETMIHLVVNILAD